MPTEYVTTGVIRKGKLKIRSSEVFMAQLARMRDGEVTIAVTRRYATRNLDQNALYWAGIVQPLAEYTGFTEDELHTILKAKFLPKKLAIAKQNGEVMDEYVIGGTTTMLDTAQFSAYLDAIIAWARDTLGIVLESK